MTFKVGLDYGVAAVLLLITAPVLIATALILRRRGPDMVFQRRMVIGRYGKRFRQLTFRSGPPLLQKLPALTNVLAGQLSLVGPRPVPDGTSGSHDRWLTIRPGLTGPWRQVDDAQQQAVLDLYYIRSYSIWLDLQVMFGRLRSHLPFRPQPKVTVARALQSLE